MLLFIFVHKVLGREDTLPTLLANVNIKVKQQTDLKTKFTVKIGGAAVLQCLHMSHSVTTGCTALHQSLALC